MKIVNTILIMLIMFIVVIFIIAVGCFGLIFLRDHVGYNKFFPLVIAILIILYLIYELGKSIYNSI